MEKSEDHETVLIHALRSSLILRLVRDMPLQHPAYFFSSVVLVAPCSGCNVRSKKAQVRFHESI